MQEENFDIKNSDLTQKDRDLDIRLRPITFSELIQMQQEVGK